MKLIIIINLLFLSACVAISQGDELSSMRWDSIEYQKRPKVGLALSGGAAHGLAHIGVLQYLEEEGIEVDYITGTSMGAVIGGLYAIGYSAKQCADIAAGINWPDILSNKIYTKAVSPIERFNHGKYPLSIDYRDKDFIIPEGIIATNKLDLLLEELFAPAYLKSDFNEFTIPFKCYGVDIVDGKVVEMDSGRVCDAVRASMAIPSIFSPREFDGRMIVDGGLIRNFPVSNNRAMGSDIVIGSYVGSYRGDLSNLGSLFDILKKSAFMMSVTDSEAQFKLTDILVEPDVKGLSAFAFENYGELIKQGYDSARAKGHDLKKLKSLLDKFDATPPRAVLEPAGFIYINEVVIEEQSLISERIISSKLNIRDRSYTTFKKINEGINAIYATKNFENLKYHLSPSQDGTNLLIEAEEVRHTTAGVNINHFNSTNSAIVLDLQIRNYIGHQSNINVKFRLSENFGVMGQYYKRGRILKEGLLYGVRGKLEKLELPYFQDQEILLDMNMWEGNISPFVMWEIDNSSSVELYWQGALTNLNNNLSSQNSVQSYHLDQYSVGLNYKFTSLDRSYFTNSGIEISSYLKYAYSNTADTQLNGDIGERMVDLPDTYLTPGVGVRGFTSLGGKWNLEMHAAGQYRKKGYFIDNMLLGGTYQDKKDRLSFVGLDESELQLATFGYGRAALRCNVYNRFYTSLVINAVAGNNPISSYTDVDRSTDFITRIGVGLSFGLDLPIGPIYFDTGYVANDDNLSFSLGIGYRHFY